MLRLLMPPLNDRPTSAPCGAQFGHQALREASNGKQTIAVGSGTTPIEAAEIAPLRHSPQQVRGGNSPYLRGDTEAGQYLGLRDLQGRSFRNWAENVRLPYSVIAGVRTYRRADIDRAWLRRAENQANAAAN